MPGYTCRCCGAYHDELPIAYGAEAPAYWLGMSPEERARRFDLTSDTAIMDGEFFFVRGRLEIPIHGAEEAFGWGVWVSMGREDFERMLAHWDTSGRETLLPPTVGYLSTVLPTYPDTLNLLARLHPRAVGLRPLVELERTDHPLAVEQREGISWARVEEIAVAVLHHRAG